MKENWPLIVVLAILVVSMLATGGLAVHLTLARTTGETAASTPTGEPELVPIVSSEPHIAYVSDLEEGIGVYVMDTDGSNARRVPAAEGFYWNPSWSPDGRHMAYEGARESFFGENEAPIEMWVSAVDGSEQMTVSQAISNVMGIQPVWSPDGTTLAFLARGESEEGDPHAVIHLARPDGSGIVQSISLPWMTYGLNWSPDGDTLLLVSDIPEEESSVWLLPLEQESEDEEGPVELFEGALSADWSPDGEQIVVSDYVANAVVLVSRDGEPRLLAQVMLDPVEVAWSPDGAYIAVAVAASIQQGYGNDLHLVEVETGETTPVVQNEGWVAGPSWSPDGSHLLFTMGPMVRRTGSDLPYADLWVYEVATGGREQLTSGGGFEGLGVWSP